MREYGGYIELDTYRLPMLHEGALALNCGRNALAYLIEARQIRKLAIPWFLCDSIRGVCQRYPIRLRQYHIDESFRPEAGLELEQDEWLYGVNYYGQVPVNELRKLTDRLIMDNAQAYFDMPAAGVDTLYTCRKFFGVPDGALLYTDARLERELPQDISHGRMGFLLGRFEEEASAFYPAYAANNAFFADEPIKRMSKLTENLLHAIDYTAVRARRTENFRFLHGVLGGINRLTLTVPAGAYMYPLYVPEGARIRAALQAQKIYIPLLWPGVLQAEGAGRTEKALAENILPLPCDQRYDERDMEQVAGAVLRLL